MKKLLSILLVVLLYLPVLGQDILKKPNPPRLVNDAANILTAEQKEILESKLVALDDSTSNQVAVVLIKTLDGYGIEEYANKLFREWGIGNKKTNNGVLIIAAIDDRKLRIEVGYGLEGAIPDVITSSIIRNEMSPSFKEGNYYRGIDNAVNAISKAAAGEYKVKKERKGRRGEEGGGSVLGFVLIVIVIIIVAVIRGGRGGGPRGGMGSRSGFGDIATGMLISSLLNGGRGGGSSWGGGSGGWGGGGGGFGGFGGGSSGGGGASGSW